MLVPVVSHGTRALAALGPPVAPAVSVFSDDSQAVSRASRQYPVLAHRKGPSCRHGRTEETHKHYNGVCLSDHLACA